MKVCFVSLYETTNFGDPILAYCAEWLFADEIKSKNVEIVRASLCWSNAQKFKNIKLNSGWHFLWKICKKLRLDKHKRWITIHAKHQLIIDNFASQIGNVDLIILAGGGLIKFKYENFWLSIPSLLEYAHQKHIPVVMNAVGVEGYNDTDFRCLDIKRALLRHSPKYISTRDDLVTLIQQYFDGHPKMQCVKVADPAVWAAEAYGVSQMKESETVGLGVARDKLFVCNGVDIEPAQLLALYVDIALVLIERGHKIEVFTNGLESDNRFATEVMKKIPDNVGIFIPDTPQSLVEHIATYKGVVATRLHSCIIAYSLDIPVVGLVWNPKMTMFGENIVHPEYFITHDCFRAEYIADIFATAVTKGYNQSVRGNFRETIRNSIQNICDVFINNRYE